MQRVSQSTFSCVGTPRHAFTFVRKYMWRGHQKKFFFWGGEWILWFLKKQHQCYLIEAITWHQKHTVSYPLTVIISYTFSKPRTKRLTLRNGQLKYPYNPAEIKWHISHNTSCIGTQDGSCLCAESECSHHRAFHWHEFSWDKRMKHLAQRTMFYNMIRDFFLLSSDTWRGGYAFNQVYICRSISPKVCLNIPITLQPFPYTFLLVNEFSEHSGGLIGMEVRAWRSVMTLWRHVHIYDQNSLVLKQLYLSAVFNIFKVILLAL